MLQARAPILNESHRPWGSLTPSHPTGSTVTPLNQSRSREGTLESEAPPRLPSAAPNARKGFPNRPQRSGNTPKTRIGPPKPARRSMRGALGTEGAFKPSAGAEGDSSGQRSPRTAPQAAESPQNFLSSRREDPTDLPRSTIPGTGDQPPASPLLTRSPPVPPRRRPSPWALSASAFFRAGPAPPKHRAGRW